jgi:imidazolonepropionase-like amidohydrolase
MKKYSLTALLMVSLFTTMAQTDSAIQQPPTLLCITHANIINVVTGKIDRDQTILIENDRITATGPFKKIKVPANSTCIDATGKYIMPGMTDAHIHFFQSGGLYTRPDGLNLDAVYSYEKDQQWIKNNLDDLAARYLACGITTVIDVGGPMSNFKVRDKFNSNPNAPTAFVTGPLISTYQPPNLDKNDPPIIKTSTPDSARELVRRQLPFKPDFIKIWYIVLPGQSAESTLPIIKATIEESHANGLKVAVHATEYQTAKLAVTAGADILVHSVDDTLMDKEMLDLLKSKHTVYIPTLIVAQNYSRTFTQQFNFTAHDYKYANPFMLGTLMDVPHLEKMPFNYKQIRSNPRFSIPGKEDTTMLTNLKAAQNAGVLVVSGTDAGNIGTQHASSFQDELLYMQKAGLSNWDIIKASTINAAKGFGKDKDYGSIEKGKIADLLILDKDPTTDINIPAAIDTVIHRGIVIDPVKIVPVTPEGLVQQQLNAYNARNIDAFLAPYSDSVVIYDMSGEEMLRGKTMMLQSYSQLFKNVPELHCKLVNRMVVGNTIVDQEKVTGFNEKPLEAIAVYKVENGKIVKVYFTQ